jgi:L-ascorbate metabolism protein UlaG (beta-lactamase superfamily)
MRIRWYGQSAFLLTDGEGSVFVDPFGDMSGREKVRGFRFGYPRIEGVRADLVLVTHEHLDHNGVAEIGGDPRVVRSTAGSFDDVVAIASEHDEVAGTARGPNTIFSFPFGGLRVCHLGDFGQRALRPEQRAAIGVVDVLFVPVGGGPTIGGADAAALVRELAPRLVVPMHYRTEAIDFLDPPDAFLDAVDLPVTRVDSTEVDAGEHEGVVVLRPPL